MTILSGAWVLDANVVVRAFLDIEYSDRARSALEAVCGGGRAVAPELLHIECASAVWKYARFRGLPARHAQDVVDEICQLDVRTVSLRELTPAAFHLATKTLLSVYDACYLATAISQKAGLLTADEKLIRNAGPIGIPIVRLADITSI